MPAWRAYAQLANPRQATRFLNPALLAVLDELRTTPADTIDLPAANGHCRWVFTADPPARLIDWELTAPIRTAGTVQVHGDSMQCQLWMTVTTAPTPWPRPRVRTLATRVLRAVRDQLEASISVAANHPPWPYSTRSHRATPAVALCAGAPSGQQ